MSTNTQKIIISLVLMLFPLGLLACGQKITQIVPPVAPTRDIFPYRTSTAITIPLIPEISTPLPSTSNPTPTPFSHIIEKGETMLGIAIRYGIALEDLQAANPDIDPNMLSVGSQLIIPLGDALQGIVMTPTPIPVTLGAPNCYQTSDDGAWCFVLVENHLPYALENISARVGLISQEDNHFVEGTAFPPLNRIGSGKKVPLMLFFSPPVPTLFSVKTELLTAVANAEDSTRYVNGEVVIDEVKITSDGQTATARGRVIFPNSTEYPGLVWLVAVAYGDDGSVVGVRKWEAVFPSVNPEPLLIGTPEIMMTVSPIAILPVSFEMKVFSLGPDIKQVEVLLEAHP
jgi:LysM repeat protein